MLLREKRFFDYALIDKNQNSSNNVYCWGTCGNSITNIVKILIIVFVLRPIRI